MDSSAPGHLPEDVARAWGDLVSDGLQPMPGFEALCAQVARMREAQRRVSAEGLVVADEKGRPVPHPALDIERRAQAEVRAWLALHGKLMPAGKTGDAEDEFTRARRERAARAAGS